MKTKKVHWLLRLALGMVALSMLASCGGSPVGENINRAIEDWKDPPPFSAEKSEYTEFNTPAFGSELGFDVVAYPNTADLKPYKFFALEGWFGQMQYKTKDQRVLVVRVAEEGEAPLLTTYKEPHTVDEQLRTIDGIEVTVRHSPEKCMAVTWSREGFQYMVHSRSDQAPITDDEIDQLVKGLNSAKTK